MPVSSDTMTSFPLDIPSRAAGQAAELLNSREMLWQRGACNGPGTRRARMGKASQSTVDVL